MSETPMTPEQLPQRQQSRTTLDRAREVLNARMTKDNLRLVLENVVTYAASLQSRVAELEAERHADTVEYGIRIPRGSVVSSTISPSEETSLSEEQARLDRYRDTWPGAELVQRPVFHGKWTPATTPDEADAS